MFPRKQMRVVKEDGQTFRGNKGRALPRMRFWFGGTNLERRGLHHTDGSEVNFRYNKSRIEYCMYHKLAS